jgi:hypothetical protein
MKSSSALAEPRVIPSGGRYGRLRLKSALDMTGVPIHTFVTTKRIASINCNPRWRLTCTECGATRDVYASTLVGATNGENRIAECGCVTGRTLDAAKCKAQLDLFVSHVETLLAVMAYERLHGHAPLRMDVEKMLGRGIDSMTLVRKKYLEQTARPSPVNPSRIKATDRAWRLLGFERVRKEG